LRPEDADCVEQIVLATAHLIALTDEVHGAGLEQDPLPLKPQPVAVGEIAAEVAALMGPIAADRRVRIAVDIPAGAVARADPQRLSQVLINLVSNAIKYNRVGGHVRIGAEVIDSHQLRLSISDTGVGIAEDLQPRVFARLERLGAEDSDIEGSGIGLALSRAYVEAMGGAIGVESTQGTGSTFWVDLVPETPAQEATGSRGPRRSGPAAGPAITAFGTPT
jgi:signal transduction histidine kinase